MKSDSQVLVCPACHGLLSTDDGLCSCADCGRQYPRNRHGYLELAVDPVVYNKESTTEEHAERQAGSGAVRLDEEFILPYIRREPAQRVLDVGCGIGRTVERLRVEGYNAFGIDLPCLAAFWHRSGLDPERFCIADAAHLPFADGFFDTVISLGVIEHIGTDVGDCTLSHDYRQRRQEFADELLRVTRPGGRILVACPNKNFPLDPQHRITDSASRRGPSVRLREAVFARTGINVHRVWGRYHLLSYREVRQLFCGNGRPHTFTPLPIKGYFALDMFKKGYLRPFSRVAEKYINDMPRFMSATFANPYVLVEIRR